MIRRLVPGLLLTGLCVCTPPAEPPARPPPRLVLWAWERPEDLRFLSPADAEVAFLAATVHLTEQAFTVVPRRQPLRLPPGLRPRATVRLEMRGGASLAHVPEDLRRRVAEGLVDVARRMDAAGLQLDFDARESEHPAYLRLLEEVRARLPQGTPLSITALVSWCTRDGWLTRAPVEEVVPQWFRMGADGAAHEARLRRAPVAPCLHSLGVAMDEWRAPPAFASTVYVFNPRPWTALAFQTARSKVVTQVVIP